MLSEQLIEKRSGIFTASECHRLMAGWDEPEPCKDFDEYESLYKLIKPRYEKGERKFLVGDIKDEVDFKVSADLINKTVAAIRSEEPPKGLVTYAQEKAAEEYFTHDPSLGVSTVHTRNGNEREEECVARLAERLGVDIQHTGDEQIHIDLGNVGGTPDGLIYNSLDLVETGIEAKCKSYKVHAELLTLKNGKDLLEYSIEHYTQVQTLMYVTDTNYWHFAAFNPFGITEALQFKSIAINRDDAFINVLKKRIEIATDIKNAFARKFIDCVAPTNKQKEA